MDHIKHEELRLPCLTGEDYYLLLPYCYAAVPDALFDVVLKDPPIESSTPSPPSVPGLFRYPRLSPITLSPSAKPSQKKPLNPAADKDSFIRLPVYRDPVSGLTGFTWDNHAPPYCQPSCYQHCHRYFHGIRRHSNSTSTTTTTVHGARLLSETFNVARTNAGQGILAAMLDLGGFYYHGEGGALQDFSRAMRWFTQAAEDHGSAEAQYNIGTMHHQGHGVIHNFEAALEWYQRAAEQGHANAQYSIGLLYLNGEGVAQDFGMAMEWFRLSARQGNPSAQIAVGNMFFYGLGVPQNYDYPAGWYYRAAAQSSAAAQANIGIMYLNGMGMSQDQRLAMLWLTKAAKGGDTSVQRYLERNKHS